MASAANSARPFTSLGGTLVRHGRNDWRWRDGAPAPYVCDLSPAEAWNLRAVGNQAGPTHVEIPRGLVLETIALQWVLEAERDGRWAGGSRAAILVPVADWEAWAREHPIGARWDRFDEPAVLDRAFALGWRPPTGWKCYSGWEAPRA